MAVRHLKESAHKETRKSAGDERPTQADGQTLSSQLKPGMGLLSYYSLVLLTI